MVTRKRPISKSNSDAVCITELQPTSSSSSSSTATTKTDSSTGKPRKRKMLTKVERLATRKLIEDLPVELIIQKIEECFEKEVTSRDLGLSTIVQLLLVERNLLTSLVKYHCTTYSNIYDKFGIGKEKFLRFQLEWYAKCSILLLPKDLPVSSISPDLKEENTSDIRKLWQDFCEPHSPNKCKKVMILFSSFMYNMLLQNSTLDSSSDTTDVADDDNDVPNDDGQDVYYCFGGATLSSMLNLRYNRTRMKELPSSSYISQEILVLQTINTKDKTSLPEYLRYRDRGYMYTPHPSFIPFFRDVDITVKEVVNTKGFKKYTNELIKVAHSLIKTKTWLKDKFIALVKDRFTPQTYAELNGCVIENVYDEMVRKLCNIRIEEFLSSQKQKFAAGRGHASLTGQNLRDSLLSQYTNLHCHFLLI